MERKTSLMAIVSIMALSVLAFSACGVDIENENIKISPVTNETADVNMDLNVEVTPVVEEIETELVSTYDLLLENLAYKAFMEVKMGATKEEVDALLGEGVAGEKDSFDTSVDPYTYEKDGVSIWISYKDGAVVKKGTKENKDWATAISKEDFAKITEGMTYDEVKMILGEGQITNDAVLSSGTTTTYFWNIKSGYQNITIKFKDGKVSNISNMNMN